MFVGWKTAVNLSEMAWNFTVLYGKEVTLGASGAKVKKTWLFLMRVPE
jgi:hypothetical protein